MKMIKKRVAELEGAQLDWSIAKALGWQVDEHRVPSYELHKEWGLCGPIIEREQIQIDKITRQREQHGWQAQVLCPFAVSVGPTPLIAAMRAFVASKLGEEVEVPE